MRAVAEASPELAGERAARALAMIGQSQPLDRAAARTELLDLVARVGWPPAA
jgi:hypothetical protein